MSEADWVKDFLEKRIAYGVSKNKLAVEAGITRQYLHKIETDNAVPSNETKINLL